MTTSLTRFRTKYKIVDGCWLWLDWLDKDGYGRFHDGVKTRIVHRFAYEVLVGPIPDGLTLDHICRVRHCVNPAHLQPVTCAENLRRGLAPSTVNSQKGHCPKGHLLSGVNLMIQTDTRGYNRRRCRECRRMSWRRWYKENGNNYHKAQAVRFGL